jgi:hypothetical protein
VILADGASLADVAFAACTALTRAGETAVLCGGSAAAFYAPHRYDSLDLDFVVQVGTAPYIVDRALAAIGYARASHGHYEHARLKYVLEFPVGPLAIGRETIRSWRTERRAGEALHLLTPTDVVRDRFMHFWAWGDRTALDVAVTIARTRRDVDLRLFRAWVARERAADRSYDPSRVEHFLGLVER